MIQNCHELIYLLVLGCTFKAFSTNTKVFVPYLEPNNDNHQPTANISLPGTINLEELQPNPSVERWLSRGNYSAPPTPRLWSGPSEFFSLPAANRSVTMLSENDTEKFTIRISSWKRPDRLVQTVKYHSQCEEILQIQVVWSIQQHEQIPETVMNNSKVYVEQRTTAYSLNDKFDILPTTPTLTLGILTLDDDFLWSCSDLKKGFNLWIKNPERMVTYYPRRHNIDRRTKHWKYDDRDPYRLKGKNMRKFSWGLTNTAFLHRDYLFYYTHYLPRDMYEYASDNIHCEDVLMSVLVSNLTAAASISNGCNNTDAIKEGCPSSSEQLYQVQAPLVPEASAMINRKKIGKGAHASRADHIAQRSYCLNWFATELRYKEFFDESSYVTAT